MKVESLLTMLWALGGTTLSVRLLTQDVESALAATTIEWAARRAKALRHWLRSRRLSTR